MPKTKLLHAPRRSPAATREMLVGGLGIVGVVLAGVGVATVGGNLPFGLDQAWHDVLAAHRFPAAGAIAGALHVIGGTLVMTILTVLVVVVFLLMRRFRAAITVALAMALSAGISTVLKAALARPRPSDGIVDTASNAFPSGHATAAAAITIALLIALPRTWTRVLAVVWITLMALSRNYLLVHWLSDVIAGAVLGASAALLVSGVMRLFLKEPSLPGAGIPGERQAASTSLTS
ncbi:phosphatase PAP2 family protein [Salinibacterium sp. G-O1]|uniref:phosphatase PAP2 family protein n=1 Tax=Salinibacterium sp. G-O1 TaxID=3046208 RepID=UPI0024B8C72F|nr:phosphatase PAP2 family protein [Salinibacterium sp. G-O1]MDJ0334400.1 phosphatase PAP2 family protein [Salinibacterium sp. G-O1]